MRGLSLITLTWRVVFDGYVRNSPQQKKQEQQQQKQKQK